MGSCVSLNRNSESAMKHRLWSKNKKLVRPSPVTETAGAGAPTVSDVLNKSQVSSARFSGSRDEAFFDSQPWLESDCEDDFLSVNGDFTTTPCRGSRIEEKNEIPPDDGKKKRLSELFIESLRADEENKEDSSPPSKYLVRTEDDGSDVKCCFPMLVSKSPAHIC